MLSACPASISRSAIGAPMAPQPMKARRAISVLPHFTGGRGSLAAINDQFGRVDEPGFVGGQIEHAVGNIPGGTELTTWYRLAAFVDLAVVVCGIAAPQAIGDAWCGDVARHHGIATDAPGGILDADVLRQLFDRAFRRGVSDVGVGEADAGGRGIVDDRSAALAQHIRDDGAAGQVHALDVDGHELVPVFFLYIERPADHLHADIVEEHVDATIGAEAGGDHGFDLGGDRHVALIGGAFAALGTNDIAGRVGGVDVPVNGENLGPLASQQHGGRPAVAPAFGDRASAGDDRYLVAHTTHLVRPLIGPKPRRRGVDTSCQLFVSALGPLRFGRGAIGRIDRDRNAILPLHHHERRVDAMARGVELHFARKGHRGRATVEFRRMDRLCDLDLIGTADFLDRVLENPYVAVTIERVLGHPRFTGALLECVDDLFLPREAPVRNGEDETFEQIRGDALEDLRRAVGAAIPDCRNGALADVKLVHLVEAELQV